MSEEAERRIKDYLEKMGVDPDRSVRAVAGLRLWKIGGPENIAAAEKIWAELDLTSE